MVIFCISLLLYHAMDYQCFLYLFTGNEVISAFKSNQSREPVSETTSGNSSLKFFAFRTTLGTQISISQDSLVKQTSTYVHTHTHTCTSAHTQIKDTF